MKTIQKKKLKVKEVTASLLYSNYRHMWYHFLHSKVYNIVSFFPKQPLLIGKFRNHLFIFICFQQKVDKGYAVFHKSNCSFPNQTSQLGISATSIFFIVHSLIVLFLYLIYFWFSLMLDNISELSRAFFIAIM